MLTQLSQADQLPVSLQQVKAQLRLDHADDDDHLIHLIRSGTAWVENHIGKCLLSQTWRQTWKSGAGGQGGLSHHRDKKNIFFLGKLPLLDVKSVTLVAPNNHRQDLLFYAVREEAGRLYVQLKYPLPESHRLEVIYNSGFGDRPDEVPTDIRQALIVYVSCLYEHRTGIDRSDLLGIYGLLSPHRVMRLP
jgi:uncharacterized phiE125 gp8 family phage protein